MSIRYSWNYTTTETPVVVGNAPSDAKVESVYLAGEPTGQNVLISRIDLSQQGWVDAIFRSFANGHVWFPTANQPVTAPWAGRLLHSGPWVAIPTVLAADSSSRLSVTLVIKWYVPDSGGGNPNPPPGPDSGGSGGTKHVVDFNGDGYSDLFLQNPQTGDVEIRFGRSGMGPLHFSAASQDVWLTNRKYVTGDFNGDGYTDLFLYYVPSGEVEIRYGQAGYSPFLFSVSSQQVWGMGLEFVPGDFNGDGKTDVFIHNSVTGHVETRFGSSQMGALQSSSVTQHSWTLGLKYVPGDYNGDGFTDLFLYYPAGAVEIRYGRSGLGPFLFIPSSQQTWNPGMDFTSGDFNGDGRSDLLIRDPFGNNVEIRYGWEGMGALVLKPESRWALTTDSVYLVGDFNGDGRSDYFIYQTSTGANNVAFGVQGAEGVTWSPSNIQHWPLGQAFFVGDYDRDGRDDLFIMGQTGLAEIRYGQAGTNHLLLSPSTQGQWTPGLTFVGGYIFRR
ncbi:FG-GAP repeat domain-containing protein [Myxococcus xanthus]|uniref:VCBS repeat-containing protein n=1 Tax=Myxococcus xanthus TaxID=34 RepID=A0A7Y4IN11_MYXXA|nr:VCBS repeat-containing protein [Myxococcus xanthus]NOJ89850.1 VCBS repeat-containing protein [Myxococcus xanthus]